MRRLARLLWALALARSLEPQGAGEIPPLSISAQVEIAQGPRKPGNVLVLKMRGPLPQGFKAKGLGQSAEFFPSQGAALGDPIALIAIPLNIKKFKITLEAGPQRLPLTLEPRHEKASVIYLKKKAREAVEALVEDKPVLDLALKGDAGPPLWRGAFVLPFDARLTTPFAAPRLYRPDGYLWRHKGIDLAAPLGSAIKAANDGVVLLAREDLKAYGGVVVLSHGYELTSTYMHLSRVQVSPGQRVAKGEVIALSGASGIATGAHLHFQMNLRGFPIDPAQWLEP